MEALALTGGIATGKSTAISFLKELDPSIILFDCDQAVQQLLKASEILDEISQIFGRDVLSGAGELNRQVLRDRVFSNSTELKKLEAILHPRVRKECLEKLELSRKTPSSSLFIADVPLLFESGFDFGQECHLVVATSESTQRARLKARNHFDDTLITSILAAQLPIMEKVARADVVFWNEGPPAQLQRQLSRFLEMIKSHE